MKLISQWVAPCLLLVPMFVFAAPQASEPIKAINESLQKVVDKSQAATDSWLALIDGNKYAESWSQASLQFRNTIKQKEWIIAMQKIRSPLGPVVKRSIADVRTSTNPSGMPKGDYMVFYFNTAFKNKPKANELVTLVLESDGQWRVLTYEVN